MIAVLTVIMLLSAADKAVLDNSKVTGYKITGETESYLEINFDIGEINYADVVTEKGMFSSLSIEKGYVSQTAGSPALPEFHELIAMPFGSSPEAEVISYDSEIFNLADIGIEHSVVPAQPSYSKMTKPEDIKFIYNDNAYKVSKFAGEEVVSVSKSGTMRGVGVGVLKVRPFKYNPTEGTIEVYNNLKVRVNYVNADPRSEEIKAESYSPYFESALQQLINYKPSTVKADLMNWPVTYLIVASNALSGNSDLQRLIDWKTQKGFNVLVNYVASTASISTNDVWVEQQWNNLTPKPSFVLLVGDADGSYTVQAELDPALGSGGNVCGSDLIYGVIGTTGSSNRIPSMYVGRMTVRTAADLTAQVDKTIWYEKEQFDTNLNPGQDFTYLTAPMGTAGYDTSYGEDFGNPQIYYGWTYYFTSANGMPNATTHYYPDSGTTTDEAEIVTTISNGCNFYNYTAHGCNTGFQDPELYGANTIGKTNDVANFNNAGMYPLIVGNCCLTNSFTNNSDYASTYGGADYCFGENLLKQADGGAIGYIGASMSTYWNEDLAMGVGLDVNSQPSPALSVDDPGMYDGVMALGYSSQAATKHVGLMAVEAYGGTKVDWYWSSYHLMGDPSVMIYFGIPSTMTATHDGVIAPGVTSYTVTTTPYAYVAMGDQNGVLHGAVRANSSGVAVVPVSEYTVGDTGKLVITAQFKKPYFEDILCTGSTGGTFAITETSLSYGNVDAGSTGVQQFQITNTHSSEYLMGEITTPTGYSVAVASKGITKDLKNTISYSVAPQSSKTFDLTFAPTDGQTYSGDVTITSTDTGVPTASIAVSGTGIVPEINLPLASLAASSLPGNTSIKHFDIENQGQGTLNYSMSINYTSGKDIKGSGGPDSYGYKWIDSDETGGPVYSWVDITGSGTVVNLADDGETSSISMGMTFNLYGVDYTSLVIGSNGAVMFNGTDLPYTNVSIPTSTAPNGVIALIWDDLNPASGNNIYYYHDTANTRFIVSYINVPHYNTTSYNTAQILLYESGKIVYQYQEVGASSVLTSTVGIESGDGLDGTQVVYNAAYLKNNLAVQFSATPEWLSLDSTSGNVPGMDSVDISATCDASELDYGVYTAEITVTSNDGDEPIIVIPVTFTVADVLNAPENTAVVTATANEVNLGWDAVSGATVYYIYRSIEPYSGFTQIGSSGTNSYQDTDVLSGNKYFYYITADSAKK